MGFKSLTPTGGIAINVFSDIWAGLDWTVLISILIAIIPALICITIHELAHGYIAYKLGDSTAKNEGRLTLNPIKHIDPMGLLMMIVFRFGWAKPVPVNMYNFKNPKTGMAITAIAGPISNILLAGLVLLLYGLLYRVIIGFGDGGQMLLEMMIITAYISCALAIFNLIPIPPLDGSKVLFSLLPEKQYFTLMRYERFGMIILLLLIFTDALTPFLRTAVGTVFEWMFKIALWADFLVA